MTSTALVGAANIGPQTKSAGRRLQLTAHKHRHYCYLLVFSVVILYASALSSAFSLQSSVISLRLVLQFRLIDIQYGRYSKYCSVILDLDRAVRSVGPEIHGRICDDGFIFVKILCGRIRDA